MNTDEETTILCLKQVKDFVDLLKQDKPEIAEEIEKYHIQYLNELEN